MKAMETIQDLIEEAKLRTVWWALCIFAFSYFLTHTSKSMWMNIPIAILLVSGLRILLNEVDFRWKVRKLQQSTYLSHLEKKQLSANDSRLSTLPPPPKWKRKIDSPVVEAALHDLVSKILQDFVVDLWYSDITPDKEAPDLIYGIIMDVLGEVSGRVKEINLVDLLTRDVIDLISNHLDLFRKNQSAIGVDVMGTLSSEERDERLKHHLLSSKQLHPALISSESEYKYLQRLTSGIIATVLRPREAQCPLVRCFAREFLTCLVLQPIMNLASPLYVNQVIEIIFTALKDGGLMESVFEPASKAEVPDLGHAVSADSAQSSDFSLKKNINSCDQGNLMSVSQIDNQRGLTSDVQENSLSNTGEDGLVHPRPGEWARVLEAATQRRTEVLMPENLENMWTIGRNYKKKLQKNAAKATQASGVKGPVNGSMPVKDAKEVPIPKPQTSNQIDDKSLMQLIPRPHGPSDSINTLHLSQDVKVGVSLSNTYIAKDYGEPTLDVVVETPSRLKRSSSTSDLRVQPVMKDEYKVERGPIIAEFYSADSSKSHEFHNVKSTSDMVLQSEAFHAPKLKCRVVGAYFEKLGSKSFAVYSIAVTDADNKTWFVKRRYRNFERLHRQLKDIPNYTLHLPPKRIFSSSTEDAFVHQRCIQLDKYLQDLLSIANVAEQHEVWDFLSNSSKNYSFGKSSSVMRTLAVNVDDAMDDIVRQFKGVSDGLMRKVVGSPSSPIGPSSVPPRHLSWNADEMNKLALTQGVSDSVNSFSDNDDGYKDGSQGPDEAESGEHTNGWHSDNELNSKSYPPRVVKRDEEFGNLDSENKHDTKEPYMSQNPNKTPQSSLFMISDRMDDPIGVPPEWTPPNLSLPMLNLVDNVFQLNKRGWLRRQVFWISKQILQLMMEDAIDDWLLRQIYWLRRDDVVAYGIRWIQNMLWPDGTFFMKLSALSGMDNCQHSPASNRTTEAQARSKVSRPGSFEQQLEASRIANDVKKMLFDGAPTALVSLIGYKQYRRCARDLYYFLQSTICLKQVAYAILELVLVDIFPELRDLLMDIHEKMRAEQHV